MKTLVLTGVLALAAVSGVVVTAQPVAAQSIYGQGHGTPPNTFHGPGSPPPPATFPVQGGGIAGTMKQLRSGIGTRGQAEEDMKTVCDVAHRDQSGRLCQPPTSAPNGRHLDRSDVGLKPR